jgi:hypothetical protein
MMKYSDYLATRRQDLMGNPAKMGELIEVEGMRLLYSDLRQAMYMARAIADGAKGDPKVSVEEVISIHALINAYHHQGYNALVMQGVIVPPRSPDVVEPVETMPDPNTNTEGSN